MAKTVIYSNTQLYSNEKTFDGNPIEAGKVKAPFAVELYSLTPEDYVASNIKTWRFGEVKYKIGFMGINAAYFDSYMHDFWKELNSDMEMRREGRCIIGKNLDGSDKLCPCIRRCKGCPNEGLLECYNPKHIETYSIGYEYDGEIFDIEDTSQPSVEDQVLDKLCPEPTEDELKIKLMTHFDEENPRYAKIIRLGLEGKSIEDICVEIKLKPNRGLQEINNAYDAVCEYLKLRHHKKNRK